MHKLLCNFHHVSCRIENLAWNPLCCHYDFNYKAVPCIVGFLSMIALNHNDLEWVFWFRHCAVNLPISSLSDCSSSILSWLSQWHWHYWCSPTVYRGQWTKTEGVHLLWIFIATPLILQEAEQIRRQLEMFLSNFVGLANASKGHDPISKGIAIVSAAFRVYWHSLILT